MSKRKGKQLPPRKKNGEFRKRRKRPDSCPPQRVWIKKRGPVGVREAKRSARQ